MLKQMAHHTYRLIWDKNFAEWPTKYFLDIEYSVNLQEKTLVIGHQFSKLASVFHYMLSWLYMYINNKPRVKSAG